MKKCIGIVSLRDRGLSMWSGRVKFLRVSIEHLIKVCCCSDRLPGGMRFREWGAQGHSPRGRGMRLIIVGSRFSGRLTWNFTTYYQGADGFGGVKNRENCKYSHICRFTQFYSKSFGFFQLFSFKVNGIKKLRRYVVELIKTYLDLS